MRPTSSPRDEQRRHERRCCEGLLAVWNAVHDRHAVEVLSDRDPGHRRIDFVARDPETRECISIEHGLFLTFPQARRAERFVREVLAPMLDRGLAGSLQGHTVLRVVSVGGHVAPDIGDPLLRELRASPQLLAPGHREVRIADRVVADVRVDPRPGLGRKLIVGPGVASSEALVHDDLRARLQGLIAEEREKFAADQSVIDRKGGLRRVLLAEADDVWNLSDEKYARLFDEVASDAQRAGLSEMWRVAADGTDETHYWQEWDATADVPPMRRFFRWIHETGEVLEV